MVYLQPVTFYHRTSGDSFTSYSLPNVRRKQIKKNDLSHPTSIEHVSETVWEINAVDLVAAAAPYPQTDDYLIDENNIRWVFVSCVVQQQSGIVECTSRQGV